MSRRRPTPRKPFAFTERLLAGDLRRYGALPFWSWNDRLEIPLLLAQIDDMAEWGMGGFIMHARGGLGTEYLGAAWMECVRACARYAEERGLAAYLYDENGWPSGFAGGRLLADEAWRDRWLAVTRGPADPSADYVYHRDGDRLCRGAAPGRECVNVFVRISPSTVDICNPDAVEAFLEQTHRAYQRALGADFRRIAGFFTDEPQYFRNATAFSPRLADWFRREYGEDVYDGLGNLFEKTADSDRFRFRYWQGMQTLMRESFGSRTYGFCEARGLRLTGHYVEETSLGGQMDCCAGIMPFYEYEHIPGIDQLGRAVAGPLAPLQAASAAAQLGRRRVLTESFGCCGWDVTPRELRRLAETQFAAGANLLCWHLLPYSERGRRKYDYPAHYSDCNPWVRRYLRPFTEYFNRLSAWLSESERPTSVAVLHPIKSAYARFDRGLADRGLGSLDAALGDLIDELDRRHIQYHFLDETLLAAHGGAEGETLRVGACRYRYLIVPDCDDILASTRRLLAAYRAGGGRLCRTGRAPCRVEGEPADLEALFRPDATLAEIRAVQPFYADGAVRTAYLVNADGRFLYAVNPGPACTADLGEPTLEYALATGATTPRGRNVAFAEYESKILRLDAPAAPAAAAPALVQPRGPMTVIAADDNLMTLDRAAYATQDGGYSEPLLIAEIFDRLLRARYAGKLWLRYRFTARTVPARIFLEAEEMRTRAVAVNGHPLFPAGYAGPFRLCRLDIAAFVRRGINEIVFETEYFQSPAVYYALFGEGVTETLRNCLAYDSEPESVRLSGDFGVYATRVADEGGCVRADDFYLDAPRRELREPVTEGYPFFAGEMTVQTRVELPAGPAALRLPGRYHAAEVRLNGQKAGTLLLGDTLALPAAAPGAHTLELTLTIGNRNLLGPHHTVEAEPLFVTPESFGAAAAARADYALVKWGLFGTEERGGASGS